MIRVKKKNSNVDESKANKKVSGNLAIVGFNILGLALYTIIYKLTANDADLTIDTFLIVFHVLFCLGMSFRSKRAGMWVLSAVLVLVIGFSTCAFMSGGVGILTYP